MFILNRKKMLFITTSILISIFFYSESESLSKFSLGIFSNNNLEVSSNNDLSSDSESILTSSLPIANHTIILDAGHGSPDGGAIGTDGSIESELNLEVVLKLQKFLEASNCNVLLTRSDENGIYETTADTIREQKISDMKKRADIANESNAEAFISIHMNTLSQNDYSGWQTFYKNKDDTSKKIAENIQTSLNYFIKKENSRTIKSISGIYLTKNVDIPLVIVECGFLSNEEENKLLQTDEYQSELAWSIYIGIMDYFE